MPDQADELRRYAQDMRERELMAERREPTTEQLQKLGRLAYDNAVAWKRMHELIRQKGSLSEAEYASQWNVLCKDVSTRQAARERYENELVGEAG